MKNSEAISLFRDRIREAMIDCFRSVIECDGRIQYHLYVWEDGEIERLEDVQGATSWLQPRESEPRQLYDVTVIDAPTGYSVWDACDVPIPEDEAEREALRDEIIEYLMESYRDGVDELLDGIIEDAERWEQYDEELSREMW